MEYGIITQQNGSLTCLTTFIGVKLETFFLEALEEVRRRIVNGRQAQYRRAVAEYNMRVREASRHNTKFPKIRYIAVVNAKPSGQRPSLMILAARGNLKEVLCGPGVPWRWLNGRRRKGFCRHPG